MNDDLIKLLAAMLQNGSSSPCCSSCVDPVAGAQLAHSAARFNDSSSQNVNSAQQAFIQQQGAQFAQLLSLTTDLTHGRPKS